MKLITLEELETERKLGCVEESSDSESIFVYYSSNEEDEEDEEDDSSWEQLEEEGYDVQNLEYIETEEISPGLFREIYHVVD